MGQEYVYVFFAVCYLCPSGARAKVITKHSASLNECTAIGTEQQDPKDRNPGPALYPNPLLMKFLSVGQEKHVSSPGTLCLPIGCWTYTEEFTEN